MPTSLIFSSSDSELNYGAEDSVFDREGYLVLVDRSTSTMFRVERGMATA